MKTVASPPSPTNAQTRVTSSAGSLRPPYYTLVACAALALGFIALHAWKADLRVPFWYAHGGDLLGQMAGARFLEHGWIFSNDRLGAPLGSVYYDVPSLVYAHLIIQKLLVILTGNGFMMLNVYFLAFFPLSSLTAFYAMRRFGIPAVAAFAPALLFTLLPYRFYRGEDHFYNAAYWIVPLTVLMCAIVARGEPAWTRSGRSIRPNRTGWLLIAIAVLTGLDDQYNAFFALIFLVAAGAIAWLRTSSWRPLAVAAALLAILSGSVVAQALPSFVYHHTVGPNLSAYHRNPEESQLYGLQLAELLFPVPGHRVPAFARIRATFDARNVLPSEATWSALGTVGTAGFLGLLGVLFVRARRSIGPDLESISLLNIAAVLLATVGGFGTIFNFLGRAEVRAYNRISPFIAFFSLCAVAFAIAWLAKKRGGSRHSLVLVLGVCLLVVAGSLDETTHGMVPPYEASAAAFSADQAFGTGIESALPPHSAIFELPQLHFPEQAPVLNLNPADEYRPFLHTTTMRWSYGMVDGRAPVTYNTRTSELPAPGMIKRLLIGGFDGIMIFRNAYADRGAAIEAGLTPFLGPPVLTSADGSMALFSLDPLQKRARAIDPRIGSPAFVDANVRTIQTTFSDDFYEEENGGGRTWHWSPGKSTVLLSNESGRAQPLQIRGTLEIGSGAGTVSVSLNGNPVAALRGTIAGEPLAIELSVPPGASRLEFTSAVPPMPSGADKRTLVFALFDLSFQQTDVPTSAAVNRVVAPRAASPTASAIDIAFTHGCGPAEHSGGTEWHWCDRTGELDLSAARNVRVHVTARASTPGAPESAVTVQNGNALHRYVAGTSGYAIDETVTLQPNKPFALHFSTNAARLNAPRDPRSLYLRLDDVRVQAR